MDWKKTLGDIAPALGAIFSAPGIVAGTAIRTILNIPSDSTDDEVSIAMASPEGQIKIKEAVIAYKTRLADIGLEEKKIDLEKYQTDQKDVENARRKQTDNPKDKMPLVLAILITMLAVIVIGIVTWLIASGKVSSLDATGSMLITLIVREVFGKFDQVCTFEFGSTASSRAKDITIQSMVK